MKKKILFLSGWICTALALVGVILPVLPTTPFLLLAGFCFSKTSVKAERWLKGTSVYQRYAVPFLNEGGLTLKKKLEILALGYSILFLSAILVQHPHVTMFLAVIAVVKLIVIWRIPTIKQKETTMNSPGLPEAAKRLKS